LDAGAVLVYMELPRGPSLRIPTRGPRPARPELLLMNRLAVLVRASVVCLGLTALLCVPGCRKSAPPEPQRILPVPAVPARQAPVALPQAASPTELPRAASPVEATERKVDVSVALYIDAGQKGNPSAMPMAGQPATIRVTPTSPGTGRPVRDLEPVMGAKMVLVALSRDTPWVGLQRAVELSDAKSASHEFRLTFPSGGNHVLYFLFKPKGAAMAAVPAFILVDGKREVSMEAPEEQLRFQSPSLEVQLVPSVATPEACAAVQVGSLWVRKGKPLKLAGAPEGPTVYYVAVDPGPGSVAVARSASEAVAPGTTPPDPLPASRGDAGTQAVFHFDHPGQYRVLALAEVAGKKSEVAMAHFSLPVAGTTPPGGCPK
jgi:hypothetical protein